MDNDDDDDDDCQYPGRLLQQAAIYNNVELLESLLQGPERGSINAQDHFGRTALYTSVTNNSYECAERLLLAGADANISCGLHCGEMSPLHAAALDNKDRFVRLLLRYSADVNRLDASGESPLALASKNRSRGCVQIINEQLELNAKLKSSFENDFVTACRCGNVEAAESLLHGTILSRDDAVRLANERHLLKIACENGFLDVCEFLLEIGVAVEIDSTTGQSPFHVACANGYADVVEAILKFRPDQAEVPTSDGYLGVHLASICGHVQVVKVLFEFLIGKVSAPGSSASLTTKASVVNMPDARRHTILHLAVINNRIEVVKFVMGALVTNVTGGLDGGRGSGSFASGRHSGDKGLSSAEFRSRGTKAGKAPCSRQPSRELGGSEGADAVDVEDDDRRTPLHHAVLGNTSDPRASVALAALLLQHKADPNRPIPAADGSVSSPLEVAFGRSDAALVSILLRHGAKDDGAKVIAAAVRAGDDETTGVMLQYHAHPDSEYRPNYLAIVQAQHEMARSKGGAEQEFSMRSTSVNTSGVAIGWHSLGLTKILGSWVAKACALQTRRSHHLSVDWGTRNTAAAMAFVTRIDVSDNCIESLPEFLWRLPSLCSLNASGNKISMIFESKEPVVGGNENTENLIRSEEDEFVLNCPCLEEINLCRNRLVTVPRSFFRMPCLKKLNLSHNAIGDLPFDMWTSTSLLELNLADNALESLPYRSEDEGLFPQEELVHSAPIFGADDNLQLSSASPSGTRTSTPLQQTGVSDGFSDGSSTLPKYVNRWQDRVGVEPPDVFDGGPDPKSERHSQLVELNLSHNLLEDLPMALPCLAPRLEKLVLSHNRLSQIGPADVYPASLRSLDLSHNQIACHGIVQNAIEIARSSLQSTQIRYCFSPYFAKSFNSQVSLHLLHSRSVASTFSGLTWNFWTCKHRFHVRLDRLKSLKLGTNKIQKFFVCQESNEDISTSEESSKRSSQISDYAEKRKSIVLYPNLTALDLSHNELSCLTPDVCQLTHLAELKVAHNRIKELPPEMGSMRKLWNIDFSNCPVADSLRSILGDKVRKTSAVLGYLKSIRDEAVPFNRMKLMFVGVQGIGKTSLLNQLRDRKTRGTHWMDRMGHRTQEGRDQKGVNISTVGVDIGNLEVHGPTGKVIFSTWDFGGQKEYYATHQYFLSKRSLYLVVWKVTDGERGMNEILQWLINIQARVPGSPVLIVGTHRDLLPRKTREASLDAIDRLIRKRFMRTGEPDQLGLPRVLGHIEVSCKASFMARTYIQELRGLIWKVVSEERLPGVSGTRLLEQKVPARYLHLQVIIETLARERKEQKKDPVLHTDQYKHMVIAKMEELYKTSFQDMSELSQATQFLHDNGVLLHYDEVNLQDVYFLDPQWLCDMLANIITIREINGLAKSGVMKTDDVRVLFKGVAFKANDIKTYMINLLQKFEVALLWDRDHLLIPSLLPTESDVVQRIPNSCVLVPVHTVGTERTSVAVCEPAIRPLRFPPRSALSESFPVVTGVSNPAVSLVRLYLMSYFPCGFWPRLITRLLGDESFASLALALYDSEKGDSPRKVAAALDQLKSRRQWQCWQTGLELRLSEVTVLRLKELASCSSSDYEGRRLLVKQEGDVAWSAIDSRSFCVLEIFIPNEVLRVEFSGEARGQVTPAFVSPGAESAAALLAASVDRIDTLLEDWYPEIGIRFAHDARGTYLVTRLVPCIRCLFRRRRDDGDDDDLATELLDSWTIVNPEGPSDGRLRSGPDLCPDKDPDQHHHHHHHHHSCSGTGSRELPASQDSVPTRQRCQNVESHEAPFDGVDVGEELSEVDLRGGIYCFVFEACILAVQTGRAICCPVHGCLGPYFTASERGLIRPCHIAPDAIFQDVGEDRLVGADAMKLDRFLGRGAFGAVFGGTIVDRATGDLVQVALKALQPVNPTSDASPSQLQQYKVEKSKWDRDPIKNSCEAYLNARTELGIMLAVHHPSIVPLLGFSVSPLGLVLALAPRGDLSGCLREHKRAGTRVPVMVIRDIIVQVASALSYLHSLQIIYRDLKAENVLVWSLPLPHNDEDDDDEDGEEEEEEREREAPVDVRLADYGVCRAVLPAGTKGFAGTLPFMAPEIIRHNGEEAYTEKVDCYSFGMFVYELLLLRPPYDDATAAANGATNINLKSHVMSGGRPKITSKETLRQTGILDLMTLCWSHDPNDRPSMKEIVDFAQSPEFGAVLNAVRIEGAEGVNCACTARRPFDDINGAEMQFDVDCEISRLPESDVWLSVNTGESSSSCSLVVCQYRQQECLQIKKVRTNFSAISVMCVTNADIWCATADLDVCVFRLDDYKEVCTFTPSSRRGTTVRCMTYSRSEDRVYLFLDDGDIIVCSAEFPAALDALYTPVVRQYPGNGLPLHCAALVASSTSSVELWCGQGTGKICVWNLESSGEKARILGHFNTEETHVVTLHLVTDCTDSFTLYSYVYPGTTVYCWDTTSKSLLAQVDLNGKVLRGLAASKVFQNSSKFEATRWQVTCMNIVDQFLYVGTTGGCLVVVSRHSMTPLTLCQPHSDGFPNILSILPLSFPPEPPNLLWGDTCEASEGSSGFRTLPRHRSLFVTVGRGYRDLAKTVMVRCQAEKVRDGVFVVTWAGDNWPGLADEDCVGESQ